MKQMLILAFMTSLMPVVNANISIPRYVHQINQLEAAQAEAKQSGKGLAFVMSNPDTRCGLCVNATGEAFKKIRSHSVIVFINSTDAGRWASVSPMVVTGFSEPRMGRIIPKAVVTSPDMSEIWGQMSYEDLKNDGKYRDLKRQVDLILKGEGKPEASPDRSIYWPVKAGSGFFIGSFVSLNNDNTVTLKMKENGNTSNIQLNRLTEQCAMLARKLASQGSAIGQETGNSAAFEAWTSSNGTTIQARFVSLADGKITLEIEDGKTHTIPLDRLDQTSQEKAAQRVQGGL